MIVKIMSADGTFELIDDVKTCRFAKEDGEDIARITYRDGTAEARELSAMVFLLNDAGQTVERFNPKQK